MDQDFPHIFANVRKIYCGIPVASEIPTKGAIRLDVDGVLELSKTLCKRRNVLTSLQEVTIARGTGDWSNPFSTKTDEWEEIWKKSCDPEQARDLDEIETDFQLLSRGGPLWGWSVTRRMQHQVYMGGEHLVGDKEFIFHKSSQNRRSVG